MTDRKEARNIQVTVLVRRGRRKNERSPDRIEDRSELAQLVSGGFLGVFGRSFWYLFRSKAFLPVKWRHWRRTSPPSSPTINSHVIRTRIDRGGFRSCVKKKKKKENLWQDGLGIRLSDITAFDEHSTLITHVHLRYAAEPEKRRSVRKKKVIFWRLQFVVSSLAVLWADLK